MKEKFNILINTCITLLYFSVFLTLMFSIPGGDILLLFTFGCAVLIHVLIILIVYFKNKKSRNSCIVGVLIGVFIVAIVFEIIDYSKGRKRFSTEIKSS